MNIVHISPELAVSDQLISNDIKALASLGFRSIFYRAPGEKDENQAHYGEIIKEAKRAGIVVHNVSILDENSELIDIKTYEEIYKLTPRPILAFCECNIDVIKQLAVSETKINSVPKERSEDKASDQKILKSVLGILSNSLAPKSPVEAHYQIVVIGGGIAGVAITSNLLSQDSNLDIVVIDPSDTHYYQPGWTMVGGGIFSAKSTAKSMSGIIPNGAKWINSSVASFNPASNQITLEDSKIIGYEILIVCPGIKLNWEGVEGLLETIGKNGVTSNYLYKLAPYTWELVSTLQKGRAIFTQPPMPIKCTGAPQKALYLSADYWQRNDLLSKVSVDFYSAESSLLGVNDNAAKLLEQTKKYDVGVYLSHNLTRIDGPNKTAWFTTTDANNKASEIETNFDLIHVVPPQQAPDFIRESCLADSTGWLNVNQVTLQHKVYSNIYSLGDVINSPNPKTAAAARNQAFVVARNVLFKLNRGNHSKRGARYHGTGSRPIKVAHGKVVLAEFGYADECYLNFLDNPALT